MQNPHEKVQMRCIEYMTLADLEVQQNYRESLEMVVFNPYLVKHTLLHIVLPYV